MMELDEVEPGREVFNGSVRLRRSTETGNGGVAEGNGNGNGNGSHPTHFSQDYSMPLGE